MSAEQPEQQKLPNEADAPLANVEDAANENGGGGLARAPSITAALHQKLEKQRQDAAETEALLRAAEAAKAEKLAAEEAARLAAEEAARLAAEEAAKLAAEEAAKRELQKPEAPTDPVVADANAEVADPLATLSTSATTDTIAPADAAVKEAVDPRDPTIASLTLANELNSQALHERTEALTKAFTAMQDLQKQLAAAKEANDTLQAVNSGLQEALASKIAEAAANAGLLELVKSYAKEMMDAFDTSDKKEDAAPVVDYTLQDSSAQLPNTDAAGVVLGEEEQELG